MDSVEVSIFKTDGTVSKVRLSRENLIDHLQKIVGGYLELVRNSGLKDGQIILVNEDGITTGLPSNPHDSYLVGNFVVMDEKDLD